MRKLLSISVAAGLSLLCVTQSHAVNLLLQGDFEVVADPVPNWSLSATVHNSTTPVSNTEVATNNPVIDGTKLVFLKPYVGGMEPGPNNITDSILTQIVPVTAGQTYNFSGQSRWEANYSGGVNTLGLFSPLGPVASPTDTFLEMQYLNASGNPVGTAITKDVKADRIAQIGFPEPNDNGWYNHTLSGAAPAGATQLRVRAVAQEMIWNGSEISGPLQSAFWDDFSVTNTAAPGTEILLNPSFEINPPSGLDSWTLFSLDPQDPEQAEIIRPAGFANRTPGGSSGMWLSSFIGEVATPVDGTASQTVAAVPGQAYTFSGWSRFEGNYSGGVDTINAANDKGDAGKPSPTRTEMIIEFLDAANAVISDEILDLKVDRIAQSGNANDNEWREHIMSAIAPAGAASIRVTAAMWDGVFNVDPQQTAFFDDFVLEASAGTTPGDFNNDGKVDGRDLLVWQRDTNVGSLTDWKNNYGTGSLAAVSAVPEPLSGALVAMALAAGCLVRGRR
jgi:hypothetical protein